MQIQDLVVRISSPRWIHAPNLAFIDKIQVYSKADTSKRDPSESDYFELFRGHRPGTVVVGQPGNALGGRRG
jgi:hypothetical protein